MSVNNFKAGQIYEVLCQKFWESVYTQTARETTRWEFTESIKHVRTGGIDISRYINGNIKLEVKRLKIGKGRLSDFWGLVPRHNPSACQNALEVEKDMRESLDLGILHHVERDSPEGRQGRLFMALSMVPKKASSWRLCADTFTLNAFSRQKAFSCAYQDLRELPLRFENNPHKPARMHVLDMEKFYWQFNVLHKDRHLLSFIWNGEIFEFTVMPFGWSIAPFVAQYLHEMLAASLNHTECESNVYIDDAIYRGDKSKILLTYEAGGIAISVEKSKFDLRAGEEIEYLGVSVNIQERYDKMEILKLKEKIWKKTKKF